MGPSFKRTEAEQTIIIKVARRAQRLGLIANDELIHCHMDLAATHANGCPLNFNKLLEFADFDFAHDINGMNHFLCQGTGQLTGQFRPKCARAAIAVTEGLE